MRSVTSRIPPPRARCDRPVSASNNTEVLLYSYASVRPGNTTDVALIARPGEAFKVDWESFVGASEMGWPEFKKERPVRPQLFRVFAQFDDYYNYEFSDEETALRAPDVTGWAVFHLWLLRAWLGGRTHSGDLACCRCRAHGAYAAAGVFTQAESDHCVHITGVVANRWLLVP